MVTTFRIDHGAIGVGFGHTSKGQATFELRLDCTSRRLSRISEESDQELVASNPGPRF